ncbi:MAG TPA: hypothetical protein VHI93_00450 [Candidatus Thermoplasmatota archaeon]|nr:hypothetical protein [Candidatus Thermoplasmatota archaeon]
MADEKRDGSGYEFVPPDFDEDAFVHREMVSFKTTTILFVWGILAAAASWAAYVAVGGTDLGWLIGLALCGAFGYALKFLFPRLGADVSHFKRKEWVGTGFLFFFTWLSFFLVALNPPLTDVAPPQVFLSAGPPLQEAGAPVTVDVVAADNGRLAGLQVRVTRDGGDLTVPFTEVAAGHLRGTLPSAAGRYTVAATATDAKGHVGRAATNVTIGRVLDVTWPAGNVLAKPTDQVLVSLRVPPCAPGYPTYDCIRTVQLRALDGTPSIALEHSPSDGGWRATPNFAGWTMGNHTYQVVAHYPTRFLGANPVSGGNITGPQAALEIRLPAGDHQVAVLPEPTQRTIHVPAPSLGVLAVALLGLAILVHRRGR